MLIRIPYLPKSEQAAPLRACIERVKRETGYESHQIAILISYFLEEVAYQVSTGREVRIPGFGMFAPYLWTSRTNGTQRLFPTFAASRGFKNQVALECPMSESGRQAIERYRKRHHFTSGARSDRDRVYTAQRAIRQQIAAEAERMTIDVLMDRMNPKLGSRRF